MASMEARLTLEGAESSVKHHRTDVVMDDRRKPRLTPPSSAKKTTPGTSSSTSTSNTPSKAAASKAKQAAERLAAWQRRKNYDPIRAATNGKIQQVLLFTGIVNQRLKYLNINANNVMIYHLKVSFRYCLLR